MKTIKHKVFALITLLALGATMQPLFCMQLSQKDLNSALIEAIKGTDTLGLRAKLGIKDSPDEIQRLVKLGADVNKKDSNGDNPLHFAAYFNHPDAISLLILYKAVINAKGDHESAPLHIAAQQGNVEAIDRLIQLGADINAIDYRGLTPLHRAFMHNHVKAIALLIKLGANIHKKNDEGSTPLHLAVKNGDINAIDLLMQRGAHIDAKDSKYKDTPLHWAFYRSTNVITGTISRLIQLGADVNAINNNGDTLLHLSITHSLYFTENIKFFVHNGGNIFAINKNGKSPFLLAGERYYGIIEYFEYVKDYNKQGKIINLTKRNQLDLPDYCALATLKKNIYDIKDIIKYPSQVTLDGSPCSLYVLHYLKLAARRDKQESIHTLAWLKLDTLHKNDYKNKHVCSALIQKGALEKSENKNFTDVSIVCDK